MRLNCSYFYKKFAHAFWNWVKFWMFSPGDRLMCTNKTCFAGVVMGPKTIFLIKNSFSFVSMRKTMNSNISVSGSDFDSRCKPGVFEIMQKFYYGQSAKNCTDWLMLLLLLRKKESSSFAGYHRTLFEKDMEPSSLQKESVQDNVIRVTFKVSLTLSGRSPEPTPPSQMTFWGDARNRD